MSDKTISMTSISMGLDAIFSAQQDKVSMVEKQSDSNFKKILIQKLQVSPFQARKNFSNEAIAELASSIQHHGILQPLLVRKKEEHYELLAGERRLRAAQKIKLTEVPIIECHVDDETAMAFGLIENIQRQDLNAIEEASAYERLLNEFDLSHDLLAVKIGKSRSHITNMLRLTKLPNEIKNHLVQSNITMGHARAILSLPPHIQQVIVTRIIQNGLSVRQTEQLVKKYMESKDDTQNSKANFSMTSELKNAINTWKKQLQDKFHADIKIQFDEHGKGRLSLTVDSEDALRDLIDKLHI